MWLMIFSLCEGLIRIIPAMANGHPGSIGTTKPIIAIRINKVPAKILRVFMSIFLFYYFCEKEIEVWHDNG